MPSSYSASLRLTLPATGELVNTWGTTLDTGVFALADSSIAGWTTKALVGNYSLTSTNGAADEARSAMLKFTGTGTFTVTVPAVSKRYDIWNATTGILTVTNGTASVTLIAGEVASVMTDGGAAFKRVQPTDFGGASLTSVTQISGLSSPTASGQAATKGYVDTLVSTTAFSMGTFGVPIAAPDSGKFLTNNGSVGSWAYPTVSSISDYVSDQATRQAAILTTATAQAIAFAVAL